MRIDYFFHVLTSIQLKFGPVKYHTLYNSNIFVSLFLLNYFFINSLSVIYVIFFDSILFWNGEL
jgi:hypothetical protein